MKNKKFLVLFAIIFILICGIFIWNSFSPKIIYTTGKDTVAIIGDGKFQIVKVPNMMVLMMHVNETRSDAILMNVITYKKKGGKIYIKAENGYAIIGEKSNKCEVISNLSEMERRIYENVVYYNSFDEFLNNDKIILQNLK